MRCIDADALIEFIENRYDITWKEDYEGGIKDACVDILEEINKMHTIEPQRKKGKWKMALTKDLIGFNTMCFRCSECNGMEYSTSPFCRVCGAKMEEGEADEGN